MEASIGFSIAFVVPFPLGFCEVLLSRVLLVDMFLGMGMALGNHFREGSVLLFFFFFFGGGLVGRLPTIRTSPMLPFFGNYLRSGRAIQRKPANLQSCNL